MLTRHRGMFATKFLRMKTAAGEETYWVAAITKNNYVEFHVS